MSSRASGLLAQIEAGVLDDSVPLSSLLQKVIVLGGKAGSENMREWARRELNGYVGSGGPLPDYRRIPSALHVRITNRAGYNAISQRISPSDLPDFMTDDVDVQEAALGNSIGELEALEATTDEATEMHYLSPSWAQVVVDFLNKHAVRDGFSVVVAAYWEVSNASIKGLLIRVRTALAELVAELASLTPEGQEVPTKAAADQAVYYVINGERPTINITSQHTNSGPNVSAPSAQSAVLATDNSTAIGSQTASGEHSTVIGAQATSGGASITGRDNIAAAPAERTQEGWWAGLRKRGVIVAVATVVAAIVGVLAWLGWTPW